VEEIAIILKLKKFYQINDEQGSALLEPQVHTPGASPEMILIEGKERERIADSKIIMSEI
jgi:hypothetical protein